MTIETWGFNVSTSKGKFAASLRQVATQVIALAVARDHLCDRHAAHTGWFLGEPAGERQRRSLDDLLRSARINELMAVAGVKSRRTIALEETAWMNHSMADWLIYCFADHVDVPLVTALDCYFIDFHGLKEWFWKVSDASPMTRRRATMVRSVDWSTSVTCALRCGRCAISCASVTIRVDPKQNDRSTNGGSRSTADTFSRS